MVRPAWTAWVVGIAVIVSVGAAVPTAAQTIEPPRIAIVDFEAQPAGSMLPPPRLGAIIAQLMLNRLVAASQFHVFDGQWLHGASGPRSRASEQALLADARDAGVDFLVLGSVTAFSMEERHRRFGGGGLIHGLPLGGGFGRETSFLAVSIFVRILNVHTGEVVTTVTGDGSGKRSKLLAGALSAALPMLGGGSNGSSNARDAQLNEAIRQATDAASAGLIVAAPRLLPRPPVTSS